jgi:type IV secretion system protein VirB6
MTEQGIILALLNQVDSVSHQFVFQGYQQLAHYATPIVIALITLSIITLGYATLLGWVTLSLREVAKRVLMIGFVVTFSLNWGTFSGYIYAVFTHLPDDIAGQLLTAMSTHNGGTPTSVNQALQHTFYQTMSHVKVLWEQGGVSNPLPYVYSLVMVGLLLLLVGFALVELVVAKFGLALMLVLAPVMIPLWLFAATKSLVGEGWLRNMVTFALLPTLIAVVLSLVLLLFATVVSHTEQATLAGHMALGDIVPYLLYALVGIGLLRKTSLMASNMAGGMATLASHWLDNAAYRGRTPAILASKAGGWTMRWGGRGARWGIQLNSRFAKRHQEEGGNE